MPQPRGIYLITPDETDTARLIAHTAPLLNGIVWLQYRNKLANTALRTEQAQALLALCRPTGIPLLINDDLELAQTIGADGVHLGMHDSNASIARAQLGPHAIIGVSCYNQIERAKQAIKAGASYVGFGAFYPSHTKTTPYRATPELLRQTTHLGVPRVAIGGLTPKNIAPIIEAGAELLAVISGIYSAKNPITALKAYQSQFNI
ncbi:thiamine phosphate synthase [Xylella fastidiosa subsp. fastidiosa]|jgi:thiamine-phosphate pyrophosphorylase|nr:thiamine phosphate synthase [Xylella fastidiosa]ADN62544.1 thiamine-phosphate pyrophosphorylase [Xylella fastidiosa subsp. fastidiosa GB514]KAF0571306.1 thiamine-phosphate pyrophosphorylase [Xylella fastidiosa subsp. fastidiosa Mus-1]ACB93184.1 thiamine-phosphate pyrophosphorylase [Xylella fastidiosa M23]EGO81632.1 Thiamine monophosphate synthase ThiE [Xylella fastidiosa EB92.1]KGM20397.1 thiamine-phosphate pyrophosphorylase [Xylella fastidiosa]